MKVSALFSLLLVPFFTDAQVPETEIYLLDVDIPNGVVAIETAENITKREGYDNQPNFSPDGSYVLFVSYLEYEEQADVYKYDISSGKTKRVTATKEDEYSPTNRGAFFSTVRVETDSSQRLWKFPIGKGKPSVIFESISNIGYHSWINDEQIALWLLGDTFSLQIADVKTGALTLVDKNVGRGFNVISQEGSNELLYTSKSGDKWQLNRYNLETKKTTSLTTMPADAQDFIVTADQTVLTLADGKLHAYNCCADNAEWKAVADFNGTPLASSYRLAISPDMKKLAVVTYSGEKP